MTIADFGYIPYGHRVFGALERVEPKEGCQPLVVPTRNNTMDDRKIAVVDRGGCTFVRKAYHAELAGYKLVVVID
jgi:hypothetical protein